MPCTACDARNANRVVPQREQAARALGSCATWYVVSIAVTRPTMMMNTLRPQMNSEYCFDLATACSSGHCPRRRLTGGARARARKRASERATNQLHQIHD